MPTARDGRKRWNGKRNPVPLLATAVHKKTAVQPSNRLEVRPNATTKPATIPTKLNKTRKKVNTLKIVRLSFSAA